MSIIYETILGRLGSRFAMNFRPRERRIVTSPLGRFYDVPLQLSIGVKIGEDVRILPFSEQFASFAFIEQEITPTSVVFHCREPELGIVASFSFAAPFYPGDERVSTAPFFYINAHVENTGVPRLRGDAATSDVGAIRQGELFLQLDGELSNCARADGEGGFRFPVAMSLDPELAKLKWLDRTRGKAFSGGQYGGELAFASLHHDRLGSCGSSSIRVPFSLAAKQTQQASYIFAGYTDQHVMEVEHSLYRFRYTAAYNGLDEVIRYAREQREQIESKRELFDRLFADSTLDKSAEQLVSFSLQSYLSNTWWMCNDRQEMWFTVWEGNCAYHSTIDVEYNAALFYLLLWPELLDVTIRQWTRYEKPGGFMSHDMGKFLVGRGMEYGHDMEIEENCNFILLLHALYKFTGRSELSASVYPQAVRLIRYVAESDTTGNGFPNRGTANTIDDAGPAVQYAKEQTYLAVKSYSAYRAMQELAERMEDSATAVLCKGKMDSIRRTLNEAAWQGDHYVVCTDSSAAGIKDVWTGDRIGEAGSIPGWDAYSIYTTNGLLYTLMTGMPTDLNEERLRTDIVEATNRSMTRYGCKHSSKDKSGNLWISQNIWKDITAAYLGLDMIGHASKYWDYELYENAQGIGGCFVDAPPRAHLNYYPRGIASIGLLYALAGVQTDLPNKTIGFNPPRVPCRVPLLGMADWETGSVPWVIGSLDNGVVRMAVENGHLLRDYRITLYGAPYELH